MHLIKIGTLLVFENDDLSKIVSPIKTEEYIDKIHSISLQLIYIQLKKRIILWV